jgi:hypothetical protein
MAVAASMLTISTLGSAQWPISGPCTTAVSAATRSTIQRQISCSVRASHSATRGSAPYLQVLFGGVYFTASSRVDLALANPSQPVYLPGRGTVLLPGEAITARVVSSQTAFAMTAGGGLDIKINKHLSLRPIGLDYYMTRLQNLRTQGDNSQNNLRYTAGLNFTFGGAR